MTVLITGQSRWSSLLTGYPLSVLFPTGLCARLGVAALLSAFALPAESSDLTRPAAPDVSATTVRELPNWPSLELHLQIRGTVQDMTASFVVAVPEGPLPRVEVMAVGAAPLIGQDLLLSETETVPWPMAQSPTITELGRVRQHRLARVQIPRRVSSPDDRRVTSAVVQLIYDNPVPAQIAKPETTGPMHYVVSQLVLNPGQLDRLATAWPELPASLRPHPWTPQSYQWALRVETTTDTLHRIRAADIIPLAPAVAKIPRSHLRLLLNGQPQPLHDPSGGAGHTPLTASDSLIFLGQENASPYSRTQVYWLVADPDKPASILPTTALSGSTRSQLASSGANEQPVTSTPHIHVEQEDRQLVTRNDQFLSILDYRWVWDRLRPGATKEFTLRLPNPAPMNPQSPPVPATLRFFVEDWPSGTQPTTIRVQFPNDGHQDIVINSPEQDTHTVLVSPAVLSAEGSTTFSLSLISTGAAHAPAIHFDSISLPYSRMLRADAEGLTFDAPKLAVDNQARLSVYEVTNWSAANPIVLAISPPDLGADPSDVAKSAGVRLVPATADLSRSVLRIESLETTTTRYEARSLGALPSPVIRVHNRGADLRAEGVAGDVLVVEYGPHAEAFTPLVERLEAEGHVVTRATVDEVYSQFSAGQATPLAIRSWIAHQIRHGKGGPMGPPASTVILVGDCTSDFRNEFRNAVYNQVPSFPHTGSTFSRDRFASDSWFGQVSGEDELVDVVLGRFSLNNAVDLSNAIVKTLADRDAPVGPRLNTLAFVSDHSEFEEASNRLIGSVPLGRFLRRIQLSNEPWVDNFYFPREIADAKKAKVSPATTAKIRDLFHEGPRLLTFLGHGSPNIWSTERIWFGGGSENSDNLSLHHPGRHPILINMTCNSGAIDYPLPRWNVAISEDFLRQRGGGPVACYVPSGPGLTPQHERLTRELLRAFLDGAPTVGTAVTLGMLRYQAAGNPPDLARMFILLGDPHIPPRLVSDVTTEKEGVVERFRQRLALDGIDVFRDSPITTNSADLVLSDPTPSPWSTNELPVELVEYDPATGARRSTTEIPEGTTPLTARFPNPTIPTVFGSETKLVLETLVSNPHRLPLPLTRDQIPTVVLEDSLGRIALRLTPTIEMDTLPPRSTVRIRWSTDTPVAPGLYLARLQRPDGRMIMPSERYGLPGRPVLVLGDGAQPSILAMPTDGYADFLPTAAGLSPSVRVLVANTTPDSTRSVTLRLAPDPGHPGWSDSETTISDLSPLEVRQVQLQLPNARDLPATATAVIRASGLVPDQHAAAVSGRSVAIGSMALPDLALDPALVTVTPPHPVDGHTIFFDAIVANNSPVPAYQVVLEGSDVTVSTSPVPLTSRINRLITESVRMEGHSTRTLRLRWDPFANSGQRRIRLSVRGGSNMADRNPENNSVELDLRVLTKHRLRRGPVAVLSPTPADRAARQLRFVARIINEGESDAHAVRVTFYSSPDRSVANRLGEVLLDRVPPGQTDVLLVYKLQPGDENRQFTPAIEAVLKGSTQRLIVPTDQ